MWQNLRAPGDNVTQATGVRLYSTGTTGVLSSWMHVGGLRMTSVWSWNWGFECIVCCLLGELVLFVVSLKM
jgi:hypothetical protein